MQLLKLELLNWCQLLGEFEVDFAPGMTAFIGPNGSGKSNLLGAIRWLLTGDNPNDGDKAENICEEADPAAKSWGRLTFRHAGDLLVVQKWLRPEKEKSLLTVNGTIVARGEREVVAQLVARLGMDAAALKRFVIVEQGDIFGVLDESTETRAKTFQKLFDTGIAADLVDVIGKHDDKILVQDYRSRVTELEQALVATQEQLQQARTAMVGAEDATALGQAVANDRRVCDQYANRQSLEQQVQQLTMAITVSTTNVANTEIAVTQVTTDMQTLEQAAAGNAPACDNARAALLNVQRYREVQQQRTAAENRRKALESSIAALVEPKREHDPVDIATLSTEVSRLATEIQTETVFVTRFAAEGVAACPTCGTDAATLVERVAATRSGLPAKQARVAALNGQITAEKQYQTSQMLWDSNSKALTAQLKQIDAQLEGLTVSAPVTEPEAVLNQIVADQQAFTQGIADLRTALNGHTSQLARLKGQLESQLQQLTECSMKRDAINVTQAEAAAAQERIATGTTRLNELMTLHRNEAAAAANLVTTEAQLTDLRRRVIEADKQREWIRDGEEVRSVLKMLPKLIAQNNLRQLEVMINDFLSLCGTTYRVTADETLSFVGIFNSGRRQRAKRFSGGQKVLLALLFRIAANIRFAAGIDFLGLDEPTAYLDKKSVAAFKPLFERLRELMAQRGLQCLMITHEDELAPLFDKVITLEIR